MKLTGIILAGGKNLRMGQNKAFLEVQGERIIDRIKRTFVGLFEEVLLVTNSPCDYLDLGLRTVTDLYREGGALGGIFSGLFHSSFPHAFVAACDMPFLNPALISHLALQSPGYDIVIPRTEDGLQPLHAVYSRKCLPFMEDLLRKGNLKILDFFHRVRKREVPAGDIIPLDPHLSSFLNLNTPEDLSRLQSFLGKDSGI
ncbi:MAG: molybdenum cofactor guanylyltransferase [Syntrophaceae bacterium]|jgi:molybdopterin-guanine dinucleotide biosynthesis protein A|nr:molybdenum cofactor guanylyltransferase [Syntrophaceae bacterium]